MRSTDTALLAHRVLELEQTNEKFRLALAPMIVGYLRGDREAVLTEWMEGRDWDALWALVGELAGKA